MKDIKEVEYFLVGKTLDLVEIDDFMVESGYDSILPTDVGLINNIGLIWYPFEPFLNQINIWVRPIENKYFIEAVELFSDYEEQAGA